jgi:hypothetical protein
MRLRLTEAAPPPSVRWCRGLPSCRRRSTTRRCSNRQGEQRGVAEKQSKSRGCGTADLHRRSRPTGIVIDEDRVPERDVGGRPFLGMGPIVLRASKRFPPGAGWRQSRQRPRCRATSIDMSGSFTSKLPAWMAACCIPVCGSGRAWRSSILARVECGGCVSSHADRALGAFAVVVAFSPPCRC